MKKQGRVSSMAQIYSRGQLPACLQQRKSEICQVLLTLMEFWQEKQLHCSQIKAKAHSLHLLPCMIHFSGDFSCINALYLPKTPLLFFYIKISANSPNMTALKSCFFFFVTAKPSGI